MQIHEYFNQPRTMLTPQFREIDGGFVKVHPNDKNPDYQFITQFTDTLMFTASAIESGSSPQRAQRSPERQLSPIHPNIRGDDSQPRWGRALSPTAVPSAPARANVPYQFSENSRGRYFSPTRGPGAQQLSPMSSNRGPKSPRRQDVPHMADYTSFKRIENIESKYAFGEILGKGQFGVVKVCQHRDSGKTFAVKIINKKLIERSHIFVQLLQNELQILGEKSHPNIIRIVDLIEDSKNIYVVSELAQGGELFDRLSQVNRFTEGQAADIIHQIMLGLNYMHLQQVVHRDVKPQNILLVSPDKSTFDIKIADLGFAQKFERDMGLELVVGTPFYMAPEMLNRQKYTEKVDVWGIGVITYQLLSGVLPFEGVDFEKTKRAICT